MPFGEASRTKMFDFKVGNSTNIITVKNFTKYQTCKVFLSLYKTPLCWTPNDPTDTIEAKGL